MTATNQTEEPYLFRCGVRGRRETTADQVGTC